MPLLRFVIATCLLGLSGCSYSFDIKAVMIDGRLAFVADGPAAGRARCISRIQVLKPRYSDPAEGEADEAWRERVFAWSDYGGYECADDFPIFYGDPLKGVERGNEAVPHQVAPQTLEVGVIYDVTATAGSSGYGDGSFRLRPDGTVEPLGPAHLISR